MSDYLDRTKNGTMFVGSDVNIYVLAVLASGLRLYAKSGIKPNKNWTPTKMLSAASRYTTKAYKRGAYTDAADDLDKMIKVAKALPRNSQN